MIDGRPGAFVAGTAALVLIPLALYYGDVLFVAGRSSLGEGPVATWFRRWRGSATLFCGASLLLAGPAIRCVGDVEGKAFCAAWREPPRELHRALHPSVDPAVLGEALLQVLGMAPGEARRLAQNIDWSSTLLLPVPQDLATFREVRVDGTSGLALSKVDGRGHSLLWQKDGSVYLLVSDGNLRELIRIADSLE